jgi:hypothetical protein
MALMPDLDKNEESVVVTQAVGHWLCVSCPPTSLSFSFVSRRARYYRLVHQGFPTPMPMLPDTLGSRAFLKAASCLWVHRMENGVCRQDEAPVRLLSVLSSARQDSGSLLEFKQVRLARAAVLLWLPNADVPLSHQTLEEYKQYTHESLTMMASEIDDKESLHNAHSLGYKTYGTGGFMGDSEKVWPVTETKFSASESQRARCDAVAADVNSARQAWPSRL